MAKKKKNNTMKYSIWIGSLILIAVILLIIYFSDNNEMNKAMRQDGYTTTEAEDPFYKKITTGNTLDDFYNDLANERNTAYEEYYLTKESYTFLEQKLLYQNGVNSAFNATSDLRTLQITFTYELSLQNAYLLIEGNSDNSNQCEIVINRNVRQESIQDACDKVSQEISVFINRREEILQNEKVQEMLQNAPSRVEPNNIID